MKLHLPLFLRRSVLSCFAAVTAFSLGCGDAWGESTDEPHNLVSGSASLTWNSNTENKVFTNAAGEAAAFTQGDNVSFERSASVTLEENITAGQVSIAAGADVAINLGDYALDFDTLALLGGSFKIGDLLNIAAGDTLAVGANGSVLNSALVLGDGKLSVDFSGSGAAASLNDSTLTLLGGTALQLTNCGSGNGKTYTLFTDISALLGTEGALTLDSTNNAISNYFDATQPGTGFWADGTLVLSDDGILQLVLHDQNVKEAVGISIRKTGDTDYQYYEGVNFADIIYTSSSSSAYGGAIYGGGDISLGAPLTWVTL